VILSFEISWRGTQVSAFEETEVIVTLKIVINPNRTDPNRRGLVGIGGVGSSSLGCSLLVHGSVVRLRVTSADKAKSP